MLSKDEIVVFTGISNFKRVRHLHISNKAEGYVSKLSEKKSFLKYKGVIREKEQIIGEGTMTAYFMNSIEDNDNSDTKKMIEIPETNCRKIVNKSIFKKDSSMVCADTIIYSNKDECIVEFTYPEDHPLVKGHFPGNPIMMGVMQWMSITDTCGLFLRDTQQFGKFNVKVQGVICNQYSTIVSEFKDVICEANISRDESASFCDVLETKKVTFRGQVKPKDKLLIYVFKIEKI